MRLREPWVKERVLEFDENGSTLRIHLRLRGDGCTFHKQLSDYAHTFPFANQQDMLKDAFARFAKQPSDGEKVSVAEFDQEFEEKLKPGFRIDGGINREVLA